MNNIKVLIADDIVSNRILLSKIVEKIGCKVYLAKDGKEALELFTEINPDLVFMDIEMPVMNGLESANAIFKLNKDALIYAITAHNLESFAEYADISAFKSVVSKPFTFEKIQSILTSI